MNRAVRDLLDSCSSTVSGLLAAELVFSQLSASSPDSDAPPIRTDIETATLNRWRPWRNGVSLEHRKNKSVQGHKIPDTDSFHNRRISKWVVSRWRADTVEVGYHHFPLGVSTKRGRTMTHDEANELLGRPDGEDPTTVAAAFAREMAAASQRISAAPTAESRARYEQVAALLRQARDLLLGDGQPGAVPSFPLSFTQQLDLPVRTLRNHTEAKPAAAGNEFTRLGGSLSLTKERRPAGPQSRSRLVRGRRPGARPGVYRSAGHHAWPDPGGALRDPRPSRAGGMGAVFAAFDRVRDEEIAVKVLLPHLLADPKARASGSSARPRSPVACRTRTSFVFMTCNRRPE